MIKGTWSWKSRRLKLLKANWAKSESRPCSLEICRSCTKKPSRRRNSRSMRKKEKRCSCKSRLSRPEMSPRRSRPSFQKRVKSTICSITKLRSFLGPAMTRARCKSFLRFWMKPTRRDRRWWWRMLRRRSRFRKWSRGSRIRFSRRRISGLE